MIVRAVDSNNDWLFGKGLNDYAQNNAGVAFLISYRLRSFLGDCFFDLGAGINWLGFLGGKDQTSLNLAIEFIIRNTPYVTALTTLSVIINRVTRNVTVSYTATTTFSTVSNTLNFSVTTLPQGTSNA